MKLIAGKLNAENIVRYWMLEDEKDIYNVFGIGDYAIVENKNDYDLVKIISIVETEEKYVKFLIGASTIKKVVRLISRAVIRED